MKRNWLFIAAAAAATVPAFALKFGNFSYEPYVESAVFGVAILGAAFLLSWATEVAELDISRSLALAVLALVAVLPEYSVDMYFAWRAADDPVYAHYAAANMTGANRLLIGIGWSFVVLLFWLKTRKPSLRLGKGYSVEVAFLLLATLWAFTVFLRTVFLDGSLTLIDTVVFVGLFAAYVWVSSRAKVEEPHLEGPAATLATLGKRGRRGATLFMFVFSAWVIFMSAEPFAEGLVTSGKQFGIDEFLLVQWLAPLASEAPEMVIAFLFTLRGNAAMAFGALLSSKVNQWTLLIGTLPVVYSINLGQPGALPMDGRQIEEFLLTSAQSLFALVLIASLRISWRGGLALLVLFVSQLFFVDPTVRYAFSGVYLGLGALLLVFNASNRRALFALVPRGIAQIRKPGSEAEPQRVAPEDDVRARPQDS